MKKTLSLLLTLCLLLGALPTQALTFAGDIFPSGGTVKTVTLDDGSLSLQNEYIHVTLRKLWGNYAYFTVVPAAKTDEESLWVSQTPYCNFITYDRGKEQTEGVVANPVKAEFVTGTPNDNGAQAIKVEYSLLTAISLITAKATVYYEIVQLKENGVSSDDTWGVLASVSEILIDKESLPEDWNRDFNFTWGYAINNFTATGHISNLEKPGGPAIKMSQITVPEGENPQITAKSSVFTAPVENLRTKTVPKGYSEWGDVDGVYITEVYTDAYPWANPFVGLSDYYEKEITSSGSGKPIRVALSQTVSVKPGDTPLDTWVMCESYAGFDLIEKNENPSQERVSTEFCHFLWGFHDLIKAGVENVPTEPDAVDPSIYAKRLAVFAVNGGVAVEYVADDAALKTLKKQYGNPIALISGDYESKNGTEFTFTGGAALLSPSVTATWNQESGGKLVIKKDGTIEHSGVSLNAPSFKFYQPKRGAENDLKISLTKDGFAFDIAPEKNDAIVSVDIPYATVKLESASTDAAGNLVFGGNIGFRTVFSGAEFSMEKLGYGLNEKNEFKVNGVKATGSFDTEKLMTLELAKVEGEVNTFKGEERYAFSLELNAFDLFETEASLVLERSKKDGSLIPDELWFYVKSSPGIPLVPPIPIGQLNGGGAGFKDLAKTVNGDYFAIPPLKLRGALTGTYLHLIEGTGNVVLGPSELSLKATDVGIVGLGKGGQIIDSFGYSLKLNGQERNYRGTTYKGIYFGGSEELKLNLPNKTINAIVLDSGVELGAFGGVNSTKDTVYLGVGANGIVKGRVQIPSDIRGIGGIGVNVGNINLVIGGQTTFPIRNVSVSEGMKQAFNNVDIYLGAMVGVNIKLVDTRVWVLIPNIINTNFRRGGGWDVECRLFRSLPEWNWADHGVEPLVQAASPEESGASLPVLMPSAPAMLIGGAGSGSVVIPVKANEDETPYILLAFANSVTEEQIQNALRVEKDGSAIGINWLSGDGLIDPNVEINATTIEGMKKAEDDGREYRLAILRLKEGGSYSVSAGDLPFSDEKGVTVEPFEELALTLGGRTLSGAVKHPVQGTTYVLRTYLGTEAGGADYLIDEREVNGSENISVNIPADGTLAPTGSYYVTSFLMTEKTFDMEDGTTKTALVGIGSQQLDEQVSYTNTNQPKAPAGVSLTFTGNEVMRAEWQPVAGADGYRVTIYQQDGSGWINTGFGYDLDKDAASIDMALTVGGNAVSVNENSVTSVPAENLSANKTYKVGVSAYSETEDGAKYYSAEAESSGAYLPEYTPLEMTLSVNGTECKPDENGVYHAYVGGGSNSLTVTCADADSITVTRMDINTTLTVDGTGQNTFTIPDFTGTLMLRADGVKGKDVTGVFLLVSRDVTPPVLTLSDPIFYADTDSGAYTITGTADAGSLILYGDDDKSVYAAGDGSFTINGMLDERENGDSLYLRAQDSAGNLSKQQLALVARQAAKHSVTVKTDGNGTGTAIPATASVGTEITLAATPKTGYHFKEWQVISGGVTITNNKFTMPDGNVEIKAIFEKDAPTEFTVTFDGNGGTPSVGSMTTSNQKLTSLPNASRSGSYGFDGWYTEKSGGAKVTTATVFSANTTVYAHWTYTGGGSSGYRCYTIKATAGAGGSISPSDNTIVREGGNQTFTITPDKGYAVSNVKIDGKSIGAVKSYTFEIVSRNHTIEVIFMKANGNPQTGVFADAATGSYYEDVADWAVENGITLRTDNTRFSPDGIRTRAQAVTFL